ncbi:MAG: AAA family ATPase [Armatimonadetes bacterium]|nr:AAA family ATPase [Armatimonadota bacterium]
MAEPGVSFLPAADIVNAAAESTKQYLAFLRDNGGGVQPHRAENIRAATEASLFLENTVWSSYQCDVPKHLTIRPDSAATLRVHASPGSEMEIRILEYDRRTGQTQFAARTPVLGKTGEIIIDFRWLVQRCLDWLEQRGPSIADIAKIAPRPPGAADLSLLNEGLSDDQREAIRTILTSALSYVWGPPGTGKTKRVLAKAAHHSVQRQEKLLILASTNLAVDNALSAVLDEGVSKEQVARIGVPSKDFIDKYPECCEERAFEHEIRQIRSEIKTVDQDLALLARRSLLEGQVEQWEAQLEGERRDLPECRKMIADAESARSDTSAVLCRCEAELEAITLAQAGKQREFCGLAFASLLADVEALESEQTRTRKEIDKTGKQLAGLGILARVFTQRRQELTSQIAGQQAHLNSVEATLDSRRQKRDEVAPLAARLDADIADLGSAYERAYGEVVRLRARVSSLEHEQEALRARALRHEEDVRSHENRIEGATEELSRLDGVCPTEQSDGLRAALAARRAELEARLSRFKQDLAGKSVLGMTLDGFIGCSLYMSPSVDRVLIDEAPYAPIAKVFPLLSLHCPIAMLGDHLQLPPVCECDDDTTICAYWAKPAIFLEDAYRIGEQYVDLHKLQKPQLRLTQQAVLRESYRFGPTLASLLDYHVYERMGLVGRASDDTCIECVECEPKDRRDRKPRENDAEADEVINRVEEWWRRAQEQSELPTLAILTPYKAQARLIRDRFRQRFGDSEVSDVVDILNTHQAQGREWDWVFFSVSDTGNLKGNGPWFCNSRHRTGREVLNTTISRTRQHLTVFLDATYWQHREPTSLLTELATAWKA